MVPGETGGGARGGVTGPKLRNKKNHFYKHHHYSTSDMGIMDVLPSSSEEGYSSSSTSQNFLSNKKQQRPYLSNLHRQHQKSMPSYSSISMSDLSNTEQENSNDQIVYDENNNNRLHNPSYYSSSIPKSKSWRNFAIRTIWTLAMIFTFVLILLAGQKYAAVLVFVIQILVFKELIQLAHLPSQQRKLPWFRTLNWYFLFVTNYFLYGESLMQYFKKTFLIDAFLLPLATHHRFISFSLYMFGIVLFVLILKKGFYKFQFGQFAWTHMTLLLVVIQSHFVIINIFEGLIWFILPAALVITNDIAAYCCGFFFGRTPLIRVSPKKTWEGFLGAFILTLVAAFFYSRFLAGFEQFTVPIEDFCSSQFINNEELSVRQKNPVFILKPVTLPPFFSALLKHITGMNLKEIYIAPVQWHALIMAVFASLIAPFGGFFASGVKRAFKIKDFSDSIPGHGGITDRFDCQFVMGFFSYLYVSSFIKVHQTTVAHVLQMAVTGLSPPDQVELYHSLQSYLSNHGLLPE